jgi:para-nitrobenzyl esterase
VRYAPACPQLPEPWLPHPAWSEDCLYLNLWTPQLSSGAQLPVIVFFHGGANRAGYSQLTPLGPALSALGVVVVTANYRLGPFGFFAHSALSAASAQHASGNYGILDQIAALRWVKQNIARFGGDPQRITAMGQSAGAFDICLLMASPLAHGLFRQAILESGDCESSLIEDIRRPIHVNGIRGAAEGSGAALAAALGVAGEGDVIAKLRAIPAETILGAFARDRTMSFDAIVDGRVIPEQPARVFAQGRQMPVPVLVGSNADEATVLAPGPATLSDYRKFLLADAGAYAQEEMLLWPASSDQDVQAQYLKLQNAAFAYGAWSLASAMSQIGQPAFLYRFTWTGTGKRAALGAYHGEELSFLSCDFPQDWVAAEGEGRFGEILRRYWAHFAKEGQPGAAGLPPWPPFRKDQLLELGRHIRVAPAERKVLALRRIMRRVIQAEEKGS